MHHFTTNTFVRGREIDIVVHAVNECAAVTFVHFLLALSTAACVLEDPWFEVDDERLVVIHADHSNGVKWTRHALAGIILDARRLARQALANRGRANCTAKRAFRAKRLGVFSKEES